MSSSQEIPSNNLPPVRRIVVSNLPIPANLAAASEKVEPEVIISENEIRRVPLLDGIASQMRVFGHEKVPTSNDGLDIGAPTLPNNGFILPQGANVQFNEIAPGGFVPMHRTTSTDYDVFTNGQVILITPSKAYDVDTGTWKENTVETICNPGDVLLQRGTLHAWENRTKEWVRFLTITLGSEPNSVEVEGHGEGGGVRRDLPDVFGV